MFKEGTKQLYRYCGVKTTVIKDQPQMEEIEFYGESLWEEKVKHNVCSCWIRREEISKSGVNWLPVGTTETTSFLFKKLATGSLMETIEYKIIG
jgi:hypothetical protein